ncbi:vitamin B12-dependent ribonucleotide reductase [SAR202 cluster bacterium AD-802-E10_MRT_200m]|nr:vitamin B12-dependent ribonucleotide reductase [SAR202 cluster bacterium AD-802-E10_MRT_200m]
MSGGTDGRIDVTDNARRVLEKRYLLRNGSGELIEDVDGMFRRVASAIAQVDRMYPSSIEPQATDSIIEGTAEAFYQMMARLEFVPNSPTLMNAGTDAGTLSACFVLPLEDSMNDIMQTATDIALVQKYGGGTGVALSKLRPKGSAIATTHGRACGPIAVLQHLSSVSTMITQGGKRDGANMAVMDVHHPDLQEFITSKYQEGVVHNFNISVGADDAFMRAVVNDGELELLDPHDGTCIVKVNAKSVFDKIVEGAWRNGEPGMIFLDAVSRGNPTPNIGEITATNPCGEQPLLPYESCNLGSINLARMLSYSYKVNENAGSSLMNGESDDSEPVVQIDWDRLRRTVRLAVHFLDNVIDANRYSVAEIEHMTKLTRKIGLGVMGFADMLVRLGVAYDSEEGLIIGRSVMSFISDEADIASEELAEKRGVFPAFKGSRHDKIGGKRLRNACRLTVAPTGTISMIAGCSSGIEPIFALSFRKHNILEGQTLYYVDEAFQAVAQHEGFYRDEITEQLSEGFSLKDILGVPSWAKEVFVTAPEISPEWHVRMQAAFQEFTDSAISKTINFPNEATLEDVRQAYYLAWNLGCKGITVYRAGSRQAEVLTAGTADSKDKHAETLQQDSLSQSGTEQSLRRPRQRPQQVRGVTERIRTGHGNLYVTINFDDEGKPFEVFTALGKAGNSDSAQLEAVARLVSMALRAAVDPEEVISQLRGITDEPVWDNGVLVRSAPDAISLALARAIDGNTAKELNPAPVLIDNKGSTNDVTRNNGIPASVVTGHLNTWSSCPDCSGPLVYQEGCMMCRECGYNKCG